MSETAPIAVGDVVRIVKGGWTPDFRSGVWLVVRLGIRSVYMRRPGVVGSEVEIRDDHIAPATSLDMLVAETDGTEPPGFAETIFWCSDCRRTALRSAPAPCVHWEVCSECDELVYDGEWEDHIENDCYFVGEG